MSLMTPTMEDHSSSGGAFPLNIGPHREQFPSRWGFFVPSPVEHSRMNIITISREYGAGGGEVARQLAGALGWELLDHELLHQAAAPEHLPDAELERLDGT